MLHLVVVWVVDGTSRCLPLQSKFPNILLCRVCVSVIIVLFDISGNELLNRLAMNGWLVVYVLDEFEHPEAASDIVEAAGLNTSTVVELIADGLYTSGITVLAGIVRSGVT